MDKHLDSEALSDYAEGLMDGPRRAAADAHLAGCADCRRDLAAVQAYFRGLGGLEPVSAPADFLAKVRARLPQSESPWRRFWSHIPAVMRVPMPIAVAVILGVTAITVYFRQGGPDQGRAVPMSAPASQDAAPVASLPSAAPTNKDAAPIASLPSAPAPAQPALRPQAHASGSLPKALSRPSEARIAGRRGPPAWEESPPISPSQSEPAPGSGGRLANVPENVPASSAPPADRMKAEEASGAAGAAPERKEAPSRPSAAKARSAPAEKKAVSVDGDPALPFSGYDLTLKSPDDSANVLSGLRAMGIRYEAGIGDPHQYSLIVPAPMRRELAPYLSRYGTVVPQGSPPGIRTDSVAVRLRLRLPTP